MMVALQVLTLCVKVDGMIDFGIVLLQMGIVGFFYTLFLYFCWISENWTFFYVSHLAFLGLMVIAYAV